MKQDFGLSFWILIVVVSGFLVLSTYTLFRIFNMTDQNKDVKTVTNQVKNNMKKEKNNISVLMKTNMGDIALELYKDKAPITVENLVKLTKSGFYDGTKFHRVIKGFMIQGGDPLSKDDGKKDLWGTGGPDYVFQDEFNDIKLEDGVLAMANSGPNTNGSQFFIVTAPATPWLDGKHTAFGRVVSGMDIVRAIENVKTDPSRGDQPVSDVVVNRAIAE